MERFHVFVLLMCHLLPIVFKKMVRVVTGLHSCAEGRPGEFNQFSRLDSLQSLLRKYRREENPSDPKHRIGSAGNRKR